MKKQPSERISFVRILPMSPDESGDCSIEEAQSEYFLDRFPNALKGEYRCHTLLDAPPGTMVLFQYRRHIIALAVYLRPRLLPRPDSNGYRLALVFDPQSIRVFPPVTAEQLKEIWPRDFKRFSQAKKKLPAENLPRLHRFIGRRTAKLSSLLTDTEFETDNLPKGGRIPTSKTHLRRGSSEIEVSRDHARMQTRLVARLVARYGSSHVAAEAGGVDVRVRTKSGFILFEIKPDESPRVVIRQALGQLLEYAYFEPKNWRGAQLRLVIVGRSRLDPTTKAYMKRLASTFRLPLVYQHIPL